MGNEKYEISLADSSNDYSKTIWKGGGINIIEEHIEPDTGMYRYYFNTYYTSGDYSSEVNWCINYFMLDLYNGIRVTMGQMPFKTNYSNSGRNYLKSHIEAYNIINEVDKIQIDFSDPKNEKSLKLLKLSFESKNMRDVFVLLSRVYKFDENTFVNMYRIYDTAKVLKKIMKEFGYSKDSMSDLEESLKIFDNHNNKAINNYMDTGIFSRHGNQLRSVSEKTKINDITLIEDTIELVRSMYLVHENSDVDFDELEKRYMLEKNK